MSSDLQKNLRSLGPDLLEQLTLENVRTIAFYMESDAGLHRTELDTIRRCSTGQDAVIQLREYTRSRGDASVVSLANALKRIEKYALADRLVPAVQQPTIVAVTSGKITEGSTPAVSREVLSNNLRIASCAIIERLTDPEIDEIVSKLYSTPSTCITVREKESVEVVKGAIKRAGALLDILEKKDAHVIQQFASILRALKKPELADMVQFGSVSGR